MLNIFQKSYEEYYQKYQDSLAHRLSEANVEGGTIEEILKSGFYLFQQFVYDGYYGPTGKLPFQYFLSKIRFSDRSSKKRHIPFFLIRSYDDAKKVLDLPQYNRFEDDICFRGQVQHFSAKRPYPHPVYADDNGNEPLLLPGFWRNYLVEGNHVSNNRPVERPESTLDYSFISDRLHYHGIDVPGLKKKNIERYGFHSNGDMEDFPDLESQEFIKRYNQKLNFSKEQSLIEQHYGIPTVGLDVTFDLKTALFFATNKFVTNDKSKATFKPIESGHKGVVYLLRFTMPKLRKTTDIISKVHVFEHIPPIRPLKQSCALPYFLSHYVNEATAHIIGILKIEDTFDFSGHYNPIELFPSREDDPFYNALLELKEVIPELFKDIPDYDFSLFE